MKDKHGCLANSLNYWERLSNLIDLPQQPVPCIQPQFSFLSLHPSPTKPIQIEEYSIFH